MPSIAQEQIKLESVQIQFYLHLDLSCCASLVAKPVSQIDFNYLCHILNRPVELRSLYLKCYEKVRKAMEYPDYLW